MNKARLNGTAKLDLLARLTRLFTPAAEQSPHSHALSQHTVPAGDDHRWLVKHTGPNYATRRSWALANRTRDERRRLSPIQLPPAANQPYRKATR